MHEYDVVVLGAGRAGLAVGYHLQRDGLEPGSDFVLVDAADGPGGSWPRMWDGLRLFSPRDVLVHARLADAAVGRRRPRVPAA